jgi:hypothetical protein
LCDIMCDISNLFRLIFYVISALLSAAVFLSRELIPIHGCVSSEREIFQGYYFFLITIMSVAMFYLFGEDAAIATQVTLSYIEHGIVHWDMFAAHFSLAKKKCVDFLGVIFRGVWRFIDEFATIVVRFVTRNGGVNNHTVNPP